MAQIAGEVQPGFLNMPKLPVAGFMIRTAAFMLDLFLVLSVLHFASVLLPGFFWALGEWSPYLTGTLVFLYFVLGNGPVGKGKTLGKAICGLEVTTYDGDIPAFREVFIRTITLLPLFVTIPLAEVIFGTANSITESYYKTILTRYTFIAILIATALTIPFNPFKQGLHDFLGKTLVRRKSDRDDFLTFEEMVDKVGVRSTKFHRQPQYSGGITLIILLVLLSYLGNPWSQPDSISNYLKAFHSLNDVRGFESAIFEVSPIPAEKFREAAIYAEQEEMIIPALEEDPTTGTLTLVIPVMHEGSFPFDPESVDSDTIYIGLTDKYYDTVFPALLTAYRASESDILLERADEWEQSEVRLVPVLIELVGLFPYPQPLMRLSGSATFEYPPLKPNKEE